MDIVDMVIINVGIIYCGGYRFLVFTNSIVA